MVVTTGVEGNWGQGSKSGAVVLNLQALNYQWPRLNPAYCLLGGEVLNTHRMALIDPSLADIGGGIIEELCNSHHCRATPTYALPILCVLVLGKRFHRGVSVARLVLADATHFIDLSFTGPSFQSYGNALQTLTAGMLIRVKDYKLDSVNMNTTTKRFVLNIHHFTIVKQRPSLAASHLYQLNTTLVDINKQWANTV